MCVRVSECVCVCECVCVLVVVTVILGTVYYLLCVCV